MSKDNFEMDNQDCDLGEYINSPTEILVQDIVNGIIETGSPPYSDTLFVDKEFCFFEPKNKDRELGNCGLVFPKKCYVGIFSSKKYQFWSKESITDYLSRLDLLDPYEVCELVRERFPGCAIGVAGGFRKNEPASVYNIIWIDERTWFFYSIADKEIIELRPLIIIF